MPVIACRLKKMERGEFLDFGSENTFCIITESGCLNDYEALFSPQENDF